MGELKAAKHLITVLQTVVCFSFYSPKLHFKAQINFFFSPNSYETFKLYWSFSKAQIYTKLSKSIFFSFLKPKVSF